MFHFQGLIHNKNTQKYLWATRVAMRESSSSFRDKCSPLLLRYRAAQHSQGSLIAVSFTLQAADAELSSPPANSAAYHPGGHQLLPHAHLHDLQWVPLHCCSSRGRHRVLSFQLEEGGGSGHHRALPLTSNSMVWPYWLQWKQFKTGRHYSYSNLPFLLLHSLYTRLLNRGLASSLWAKIVIPDCSSSWAEIPISLEVKPPRRRLLLCHHLGSKIHVLV